MVHIKTGQIMRYKSGQFICSLQYEIICLQNHEFLFIKFESIELNLRLNTHWKYLNPQRFQWNERGEDY